MCAESGLLVPNWCVIVIENVLLCIVDINLVISIEMSSEQNLNSSLSTVLYYVSFPKLPNRIIWFISYCGTQYVWETLGKPTSI